MTPLRRDVRGSPLLRTHAALLTLLALAACGDDPPAPAPGPVASVAVPPPAPVPTRALKPGELPSPELDAARPLAGAWTFKASATGAAALYGKPTSDARFAVRCDPQARRIVLAVAGRAAGPTSLRIVTGDAASTFPARMPDGTIPVVEASVATGVTFLDALARADGFAVMLGDGAALRLPGDAAIGRVVRGCRPGG